MNDLALYTDGFTKNEGIDADVFCPNSNIRCTYTLNVTELSNSIAVQVYTHAHSRAPLKAIESGSIKSSDILDTRMSCIKYVN